MGSRKTLIIKKSMQTKLIFTIILLFLLVFVISFFNVYILFNFFLNRVSFSVEQDVAKNIVKDIFSRIKMRLFLLLVVNLIVIILVGILFTHQIAGPAFNIERCIKRMTDGDLSFQVKLRKTDQLTDLESALNEYLIKTREHLKEVQTQVQALKEKLESEKVSPEFIKSFELLAEKINYFVVEPKQNNQEKKQSEATQETTST